MVFLGLGSNMGDREENILAAVRALNKHAKISVKAVSSLYETAPFGVKEQDDFLNAVAGISTTLAPYPLLTECLHIEQSLGRVRGSKWGPRIIDIDVLVYNDIAINCAQLTIPHPFLAQRRFVLVPLAEIAGSQVIAWGKTADELLEQTTDSLTVRLYKKLVL